MAVLPSNSDILSTNVMDQHETFILISSLAGLLAGLLVAELAYKKSAKRTHHVKPATIIVNSHNVVWQKLTYYGTLVTFIGADFFLSIRVPELCYSLVVFAIVGGDVQKLSTKFLRVK